MTASGVVLDASALVVYAQNDLPSLPVDELLRELREDTGGAVLIPGLAYDDAIQIVGDDKDAAERLESLGAAHGVRPVRADVRPLITLLVTDAGVSHGMAHAMVLAAEQDWLLATYAAPTLERAGFTPRLILDLDELFHDG